MSYILEALKKAQAERQLGTTPDVHAPTLDAQAAYRPARPQWLPVALGGAVVCVVVAAALWWRHEAPAAGTQGPQGPQAAPNAAAMQGAIPAAAVTQTAAAPATPEQGGMARNGAAPAGNVPPSGAVQPAVAHTATAQPASQQGRPQVAQQSMPQQAAVHPVAPQDAAKHGAAPPATVDKPPSAAPQADTQLAQAPAKPAPPPEPQDEVIPTARDLPEPIQRILPTVTMGGYMYSRNPADRLVLIDKALRREGDEVAPGLVLEKLLPKGAVFTFRGYRYRVPY